MTIASPYLLFILAVLVTWRLTHLLAFEDGPWSLIAHLRRLARTGFLGDLLDCFNCLSLWVAAVVAVCLRPGIKNLVLVWLALSGAACLLDRIGREPVVVQSLEQGGSSHELLRPESGGSPEVDRTGDATPGT